MLLECLWVAILLFGASAKSNPVEYDSDKLSKLRTEIVSAGCDATIVTSDDEHQNEFVADSSKRIRYISGFSGSAGTVVVTNTKAILWTDGRYHIQAAEELEENWTLMRAGLPEVPKIEEWIKTEFPKGANVCADPKLIPAEKWHEMEEKLRGKNGSWGLAKTKRNLVDAIWKNKPEENSSPAFVLDTVYSGNDWYYKVNRTRLALTKLGVSAMVVTALDDICWLLNLRGSDIPYTPLVNSYVFLNQSDVILFLEKGKAPANFSQVYEVQGQEYLRLIDYERVWLELPKYAQWDEKILVPTGETFNPGASKAIHDLFQDHILLLERSPIIHLKAEKNEIEIKWMRHAHLQDAVALCEFFEYLEEHWSTMDELSAARILDRFRSKLPTCVSLSFPTISAYGNHSAQPHYIPTENTSVQLKDGSLFTVDSGGQYLGGTTDVTRTVSIGEPSEEQKDIYTRILMGSIDFSSLIFPSSVSSAQIDLLARAPFWEVGYDYLHGTGHGVGSFLLIHESPINIRFASKGVRFKPGHFTSIEPGMYLEGKFGARLENVVEVVQKTHLKYDTTGTYLGFESVTLFPYESKLVNFDLLSKKQMSWLEEYHRQVLSKVGNELKKQGKISTYDWLAKKIGEFAKRLK